MMTDHHHGKVKDHLMEPRGEEGPGSSPSDPPSSITTPGSGGSSSSDFSKSQRRIRTRLDYSGAGLSRAGKNLNSPDCVGNLESEGTGKILQGKSEPNGNYVTLQETRTIQEQRCQDGPRKRRPVTVDTSKAKTSLEALKLSIKQLKWKEVRYHEVSVDPTLDSELIPGSHLLFFTNYS